jgi:hypothetical protein
MWRVDGGHLAWRRTNRGEDTLHVWSKIAAIAGADLLALTVDLGNGRTFKNIATLPDSVVRVGHGTVYRL